MLSMGQSLHPATRPSRLPPLTHIAVVLLLSLSFLSGLAVWRAQVLQERTLEPRQRTCSTEHPLMEAVHGSE